MWLKNRLPRAFNPPLREGYLPDNVPLEARAELAVESLSQLGFDQKNTALLGYYPGSQNNPFHALLYQSSLKMGFGTLALNHLRLNPVVKNMVRRQRFFIHLHWVRHFLEGVTSRTDALKALESAKKTIRELKSYDFHLIWTIHNILSHKPDYPEVEADLRRFLNEKVDTIHIMNPETQQLCAPYYELDTAKIVHIPHPSYQDIYPGYMSSENAKYDLSYRQSDKVLLVFGGLAPYKGIEKLIELFSKLRSVFDPALRLLIVGSPDDAAYHDNIRRLAAAPGIRLFDRRVSDFEIQRFFRAADVIICPYRRALNSGVATTAMGFHRKLIVPETLLPCYHRAEHISLGRKSIETVFSFKPDNQNDLEQTIIKALSHTVTDQDKNALTLWNQSHSSATISDQFFHMLRSCHG